MILILKRNFLFNNVAKTKGDGEDNEDDEVNQGAEDKDSQGEEINTTYRLAGVVVHSGQASGGHYYSYIRYIM